MQIVIAGGGPAGATCARTLARAGIRTVLIEASPAGDKPCAGGLPSVLLQRYPVPDLLIRQKATGVIFQAPSGYRVTARFPEGEFIATVNRREFDRHLRWLAEDAGAILVHGQVTGYDEKGSTILVKYRDQDRIIRTTQTDFLVGADGAWSRIALQAMGKRLPMVIAVQQQIVIPEDRRDVLGDNCLFNYSPAVSPDFYGWIFPKGDHVSAGVGTSMENRGRLLALMARMNELHSDLLEGGEVIKRNGAMIPLGQYKEHGARRVLLAGDAAGLVLPASGEGIYFAMRSGEIAGEVIEKLGAKRADIVVSRYTDLVNAEFVPVFNYFRKIERAVFGSARDREVFVRLARDRFMAQKILSAFSSKARRRTPFFRKIGVMFSLMGIRLNVAMSVSKRPGFGE